MTRKEGKDMPIVRLEIPDELWRRYRSLCVLKGTKVSEAITDLLTEWVEKAEQPITPEKVKKVKKKK